MKLRGVAALMRQLVTDLHIIQQHGDWSTQRHVVNDLLAANLLVVFVLHEDGQKALRLPGHLLGLRGQHTHAADVFPEAEAELLPFRKHRRALLIFIRLGDEEGVDLHGLFHDKDADVPFAVVAQLGRSVGVSHCV